MSSSLSSRSSSGSRACGERDCFEQDAVVGFGRREECLGGISEPLQGALTFGEGSRRRIFPPVEMRRLSESKEAQALGGLPEIEVVVGELTGTGHRVASTIKAAIAAGSMNGVK